MLLSPLLSHLLNSLRIFHLLEVLKRLNSQRLLLDMTSRLCNFSDPKVLKLKLLSPRVKEDNGRSFLVNKEPTHMSKLNGVVEVEDLQEATREENFQVGAAYVFLRHPITGTWSQQAKLMSLRLNLEMIWWQCISSWKHIDSSATEDDQSGDVSGAVYHFYEKNGMWIEMQKFGYLDHECGLGCPQDTKIPRSTVRVQYCLTGQCLNSRWLSKNEGTIG